MTVDIRAEGEIVVLEVENDAGRLAAPLTAAEAREFALRLWLAADEVEGVERD